MDFSGSQNLDDYAVSSLLAIAFVAAHRHQWLGLFGLREPLYGDLKRAGLDQFLLQGMTSADAYEELCTKRQDDPIQEEPPSFDILQFVREEIKFNGPDKLSPESNAPPKNALSDNR